MATQKILFQIKDFFPFFSFTIQSKKYRIEFGIRQNVRTIWRTFKNIHILTQRSTGSNRFTNFNETWCFWFRFPFFSFVIDDVINDQSDTKRYVFFLTIVWDLTYKRNRKVRNFFYWRGDFHNVINIYS